MVLSAWRSRLHPSAAHGAADRAAAAAPLRLRSGARELAKQVVLRQTTVVLRARGCGRLQHQPGGIRLRGRLCQLASRLVGSKEGLVLPGGGQGLLITVSSGVLGIIEWGTPMRAYTEHTSVRCETKRTMARHFF
mmetsp:Transcript_44960/g.144052  ORF Transcript_44960/g.144052 Transcript_44960/m.144052 type:complete len:135 (-) Transcript_44960:1825-2229(-)